MRTLRIIIVGLLLVALISSCARAIRDGEPAQDVAISEIDDARPRIEPLSAQGNPSSYNIDGQRYYPLKSSRGFIQQGIASWYGTLFHGRKTANGEVYDMYKMTAAHKTLPLPSFVTVKNLENGLEITVRVNDRGPFVEGRIIDLSYVAALKLGMRGNGTARVEIRDAYLDEQQLQATENYKPLYYLQLGAFAQRRNAEQLRQRVADVTDVKINVSPVTIEDATLHRVRIGPFNGRQSANEVSDLLIREGIVSQALLIIQ